VFEAFLPDIPVTGTAAALLMVDTPVEGFVTTEPLLGTARRSKFGVVEETDGKSALLVWE
jgi:hypothetical protein